MIALLGERLAAVFRRTAPDPFVLVVLLSLLTVGMALAWGTFPNAAAQSLGVWPKLGALLDAWRGDQGLWKFLAFGMQMCLVLLTGHALAAARPVARLIDRLSGLARTGAQGAALVGFVAAATALLNWGLGLVVGAMLARAVGRNLHARGIPAHYPLLAAAGYMGLLIWHGGLSGSAPLSMTSLTQAKNVLPAAFVAEHAGSLVITLDRTTFSRLNLVTTLGSLVLIPTTLYLLAPAPGRDGSRGRGGTIIPITAFPRAMRGTGLRPDEDATGSGGISGDDDHAEPQTVPDRLDRSPVLAWAVAVPLALGLVAHVRAKGAGTIGLTEVIGVMLALGLVLHGSLRSYARACEHGASDCAGIIVQFPLYGGILAMMNESGLARQFAHWMADHSTAQTLPLFTFLAACVLNMFITSGGGLWGVQGPVALESGLRLGVDPGRMVMSVAYGDQVTNMLQPFWALPLLAITGCRARDIVGYTFVVMVVVGAWIGACLVVV